jgi:uncharacterized protein YcfL
MKKLILLLLISFLLTGCSGSKKELYTATDKFVSSLTTDYQSYGMLGGIEQSVTTSDGLYTITPIGRLINVKIQKVVDKDVYEDLRKDLENHYKNDSRVNSVYICKAGTVMIDCRN